MANRPVTILVKKKQTTGGAIPGSALMGEPFINLFDGVLKFSATTGGSFEPSSQANVFEVGSSVYNQKISNRLNINSNFIISGNTGIISTYSGVTGAGLVGTFLSGTSAGFVLGNISDIQGTTTRVQPGVNITTGGTADNPTVNLVDSPSVNGLSVSGTANFTGTLQSGGTDLYSIFLTSGELSGTSVSAGSNINVQLSGNDYTVSVVGSPSFNNINYSGTSTGGNSIATNVSATTFYSAGTNLETVIGNIVSASGPHTFVQPGTNTTTGGTASAPTVNLVASPSINNLTFSGTATGGALSANTISGGTLYSGSTNLGDIINSVVTGATSSIIHTAVQPGTNITTGGTASAPTVNLVASPFVNNISFSGTGTGNILNTQILTATAITDSNLTSGWAVYATTGGLLKNDSGFTYDDGSSTLFAQNMQVGSSSLSGNVVIWGDVAIMGQAISAFTSQLYIEDNNIILNYNPTASTTSTSLGAGLSIQDGDGIASGDVFWDIRGTATGVANRGFATNLNDIYIRESGTTSSPGGVRVLAELDVLDGGQY